MNTAVVYASKHGCTAEVAQQIAEGLTDQVDLINLADAVPDLSSYATLVLGTAIYVGKPRKAMKELVNSGVLTNQRIGLFVCGMQEEPETRQAELAAAYPEALRDRSVAVAFLGGQFRFSRMSRMERFVIKRLGLAKGDVEALDRVGIARFIEQLNNA